MRLPLDALQNCSQPDSVSKSLGVSLCKLSGWYLHYPKVTFCVMGVPDKMFVFLVPSQLLPGSVF